MMRSVAVSVAVSFVLVGCGGGAPASPGATTSVTRPVRIDSPEEPPSGPRPVRVEATPPGEAPESEELASPPPVEAPTAHL